jgi:hypothetical protein
LPSYYIPLAAFILTTLLSLAFSPDPWTGEHQIGKFVLYPMGLLAAAFVTSESRAVNAYKLLLAVAVVSAVTAIIQFGIAEAAFLKTGEIADDPTLLNRITGPLGHWMTFSGVQLLVWCAAIPAIAILGRKWSRCDFDNQHGDRAEQHKGSLVGRSSGLRVCGVGSASPHRRNGDPAGDDRRTDCLAFDLPAGTDEL